MSNGLPVGPYRTVNAEGGLSFPFYIIPFDEDGKCTAPKTSAHLLDAVRSGDFTDIFLFSHGWNNDWEAATNRYENFLQGYLDLADQRAATDKDRRKVKPLLAGVFWPSTALVWPWEDAPEIAGTDSERQDQIVALEREDIRLLAETIDPGERERFYELAQEDEISESEAMELAALLMPAFAGSGDEVTPPSATPERPDSLVNIWRKSAAASTTGTVDTGDFGMLEEDGESTGEGPEAAGLLDRFDPRKILRLATVRQMKDRAGVVGAKGVGPLLRDLLAIQGKTPRVHLIGHSYGCRVVLSALCSQKPARPVNSVLLLQPAISHLCFASKVEGSNRQGGYRSAIDPQWVEQPILTTFTPQDIALHKIFHTVFWREQDLGEAEIAGGEPSRYAALGGYGPGGCTGECETTPIKTSGTSYNLKKLPKTIRVLGLNGDQVISGHGDISTPYTWWALYQQVTV